MIPLTEEQLKQEIAHCIETGAELLNKVQTDAIDATLPQIRSTFTVMAIKHWSSLVLENMERRGLVNKTIELVFSEMIRQGSTMFDMEIEPDKVKKDRDSHGGQ